MSYEVLEISWFAVALFFVFPQVIVGIIISSTPSGLDKAIEYFEDVMLSLNGLLTLSFISLLFAIGITWYYFLNHYTFGMYLLPSFITVIGITMFILTNRIISRFMHSRLRLETQIDISPEKE